MKGLDRRKEDGFDVVTSSQSFASDTKVAAGGIRWYSINKIE